MYLIGIILLCLTGTLIFLVLSVILLPFTVSAEGDVSDETLAGRIVAGWAWGFISFRIQAGQRPEIWLLGYRLSTLKKGKKKKPKKKKKKKPKKKKEKKKALFLHRNTYVSMGRRLIQMLGIKCEMNGVLGFDDPSDTAILFVAIDQLASRQQMVQLNLRPDYLDAALVLKVSLCARLWLAQFAALAVLVLFRGDYRRAVRAIL